MTLLNGESMVNKKKIVAAITAVVDYIKMEEEAKFAAGQIQADFGAVPLKLWGISGRQAQMQMRNMMQMRTFR